MRPRKIVTHPSHPIPDAKWTFNTEELTGAITGKNKKNFTIANQCHLSRREREKEERGGGKRGEKERGERR